MMSDDAGLISLPDGVLATIGEYLALPSRALFSAALTAPSSSWAERDRNGEASTASKAVMPPGSCINLDFFEIEKELAMRLSDDDLGATLACLDAVHTLHSLKLANCLNITGRGLEPLRGSIVLQFVDLTLVGQFESPEIEVELLSKAMVISVLQSIIDAEGSALRYLALPYNWNAEESQALTQFHRRYAEHLYSNSLPCTGENCRRANEPGGPDQSYRCPDCSERPCVCAFAWFGDPDWDSKGAFQKYTCYGCGGMFCEGCSYNGEDALWCENCQKYFCAKCLPLVQSWCEGCETTKCSGCASMMECKECNDVCCSACAKEYMTKCDACGELVHYDHNGDGAYVINTCRDCNRTRCIDCCKIQHCHNSYSCSAMICNDCQPEGWKCMWCNFPDDGDDNAVEYTTHERYRRTGPRCTGCFDRAKTHCFYCCREKLRDEDYTAPSIPSSYWISFGYDEAYVEKMESFLQEMKVATLKLKSGEKVYDGITLEGPNGIRLRHNDILLPQWQELTDALRQYNLESKYSYPPFRLRNLELHSSVLDMLKLALKAKTFHALELQNLASGTNAVKLAVSYVQNNPKLGRLDLDGTHVDKAESLRELFKVINDHPTLSVIRLKSICGETMNGHDLLPLAFSLVNGTKTDAYDIDLSSNHIRTYGATDLPDFIATNNPHLESLHLTNNHLNDRDALLIAKALKHNNKLRYIWLGENDITAIGREALRAVVFDSSSFRAVVNSNHRCTVEGFAFASALRNYSSSSEQRKIYYLFNSRNGEGSNCHHLDLELGDTALKLVPNLLERVSHLSPYEFGGKNHYEIGEVVCPLSITYEFVRNWKLPCRNDGKETKTRS